MGNKMLWIFSWIFFIFKLIQDLPDGVVDKVLEASPFNAGVYGLLVLGSICWGVLERRERIKDKDKFISAMETTIALLAVIEDKLPAFEAKLLEISININKRV